MIQNDIIAMVKPAGELRYSNVFKMQVIIDTPIPFSKPMEPNEETSKEEDGFIAEEEKTEINE